MIQPPNPPSPSMLNCQIITFLMFTSSLVPRPSSNPLSSCSVEGGSGDETSSTVVPYPHSGTAELAIHVHSTLKGEAWFDFTVYNAVAPQSTSVKHCLLSLYVCM